MKEIILSLILGIAGWFGYQEPVETPLGAPSEVYQKSIYPLTDSTYDLGTSTRRWANIYVDNLDSTSISFTNASTTNLTVSGNSWIGTVLSGIWNGTAIDVSDYTNLTVSAPITLTGDDIGITQSTTSTDGYLSSTDWNDFDNRKYKLNVTDIKYANYTASVNDYVRVDTSTSSFAVTLPEAPADKSVVKIVIVNPGTGILQVSTSGSDRINTPSGPSSQYIDLRDAVIDAQYNSSDSVWVFRSTAAPVNFANNFTGIDASTPITEADISIDYSTRVLTVTPPLGYFNILLDGDGRTTRYRKSTVNFPAFTDTSGYWYFYFDENGDAITTQTSWNTEDFPIIVPVYRLIWNATLSPDSAKSVDEYVEYHENDIPADTHEHFHIGGSIYASGFDLAHNAITSGSPNADGRNTVVGLSTGTNIDDNLDYTVTNSMSSDTWNQDMGSTTPASLTVNTGGKFAIHYQDGSSLQYHLDATRYPFPFSASNIIEYITSTGVRTEVTNNYFTSVFLIASQDSRNGEAVKSVTATQDFSTIENARAYTYATLQSEYPLLGEDKELRPLYRLIYEKKSIYDVATKYAVLREVKDIREADITTIAILSGSLPATSVTFSPTGDISSTNVQSAIAELDTEKLSIAGGTTTQLTVSDASWFGGLSTFWGGITTSNITATSTTASSTLPLLETTTLKVATAIEIAGEYISNFTTYVRSLFTGGTHITITAGSIAVDDDFLLNNGDTGTGTYDFSGATLKQHLYPGFSFPPGAEVATTTTATTSIPIGTAYTAQLFNGAECWSGAGTVIFAVTDGTNDSDYISATTTASRFAFTTNNSFTAGEKRFIEIGAMTSSYLSCSFDITINN